MTDNRKELNKALNCLFIAVESSTAYDIQKKVEAVITDLEAQIELFKKRDVLAQMYVDLNQEFTKQSERVVTLESYLSEVLSSPNRERFLEWQNMAEGSRQNPEPAYYCPTCDAPFMVPGVCCEVPHVAANSSNKGNKK